ncbi:DUF2380 domain-containing protein [Methylosarcina fibrata]|uniref:DUF2380 domain-containing protein n=1 Tax=Methylosarcina fibrata TaxID=105972 RepID=UPI00036034CA|nr:DUF2380 domain-containing protein [Methylosarcina fibrata]
MNRQSWASFVLFLSLTASSLGQAGERIAVLNFELNDLTLLPNTPQELRRTASIRPLLELALREAGDFEILRVDDSDQAAANAGFGYLFRYPEFAASLGEKVGADWVIVGQHSKPGFLFSYLLANLIHVKDRTIAVSYAIELKGRHEKVTRKGVESLAGQIREALAQSAH